MQTSKRATVDCVGARRKKLRTDNPARQAFALRVVSRTPACTTTLGTTSDGKLYVSVVIGCIRLAYDAEAAPIPVSKTRAGHIGPKRVRF
jgi:hypothetical protein